MGYQAPCVEGREPIVALLAPNRHGNLPGVKPKKPKKDKGGGQNYS